MFFSYFSSSMTAKTNMWYTLNKFIFLSPQNTFNFCKNILGRSHSTIQILFLSLLFSQTIPFLLHLLTSITIFSSKLSPFIIRWQWIWCFPFCIVKKEHLWVNSYILHMFPIHFSSSLSDCSYIYALSMIICAYVVKRKEKTSKISRGYFE